MTEFLTAALYKFVDLPDCAALKAPLQACCEAHEVRGILLLAPEGINGTIAGPAEGVQAVLAYLRRDPRLNDLEHKASMARTQPFYRMRVRLKREIVAMGVPDVHPARMAGTYVKPADWNTLLADPELILIDTRNDYEVDLGSFRGAINPRIKRFADLPEWLRNQGLLDDLAGPKPKVAMFCTGGIRCEKSTAFLRQAGLEQVYHLEGGILKYLETVAPEHSLWEGEGFVFDERVSVGHGLQAGSHELCRACRQPLNADAKASPLYAAGVSCPHCHGSKTPAQKMAAQERQRQMELARQRQQTHIGARLPAATKSAP